MAAAWVDAWNSGEPDQVLALLHTNAVIADPADEHGKVREPNVPAHVRRRMTESHVAVRSWESLAGVDSVAVVCTMADGTRRADTLVQAEDGRIVRVMLHT